jgi:hypothetical protein
MLPGVRRAKATLVIGSGTSLLVLSRGGHPKLRLERLRKFGHGL